MWETILGGGLAASLIITIEKFAEFLISHFGKKKSTTEKRIEALELGERSMLRDRLRCLCRTYIVAREIEYTDREDLMTMHDAYHALGGNGNLDAEMDAVMKLPLRENVGAKT